MARLIQFSLLRPRQGIEFLYASLIFLPVTFYGQYPPQSGLQVTVVGTRSPAHGTVVEDDVRRHVPGQPAHHAEMVEDSLWLMPSCRDGEMLGQDGVGVHQQLVILLRRQGPLHLGAVVVTQEARPFAQRLLVNAGPRAHDACRVPLQCQVGLAVRHVARLDM